MDINNAADFNNVATPIISLISGVLVYLALYQTNKQNRITLSTTLLVHYESKFKTIEELWNSSGKLPRCSYKTLCDTIHTIYFKLKQDDQFTSIMNNISNKSFKMNDLAKTSVWLDLEFLNFIIIDGLPEIQRVCDFIAEINNERNLIKEHKTILKKKIKENLVDGYLHFIGNNLFDKTIYTIPVYKNHNDDVTFQQIHRTPFAKYYQYLAKELK